MKIPHGRGFDEAHEITEKQVGATQSAARRKDAGLPIMLKRAPQGEVELSDIHRFWEQTGSVYVSGRGNDNLVDPFIGLSFIPALTGVFRDMASIRFEHPAWIPENCTACGDCYTICPDTAISGLVHSPLAVSDTALKGVQGAGHTVKHLPRAIRTLDQKLRTRLAAADGKADVSRSIDDAIADTVGAHKGDAAERKELEQELQWFRESLQRIQVLPHPALLDRS